MSEEQEVSVVPETTAAPELKGEMKEQIIKTILIFTVGQGGYKGGVVLKEQLKAHGFKPSLTALITSTTDAPDASNHINVGGEGVDGTGGDRAYSGEVYESARSTTQGLISSAVEADEPDMIVITGTMGGGSGSVGAQKVAKFIDESYPHIPCTLMCYKPVSSLEVENPGSLSNASQFIRDLSVEFDDPRINYGVQICDTHINGGSISKGFYDSNLHVAKNFAATLKNVELSRFYEYGGIDSEDYFNKFLLGGKGTAFITSVLGVKDLSSHSLINLISAEKFILTGAGKAMPNVLVVATVPENDQVTITKAKAKLDSYLGTGVNSAILFSKHTEGEDALISVIITGGALPVAWIDSIESILTRHRVQVEDRLTVTTELTQEASNSSAFVSKMQTGRNRRRKVKQVEPKVVVPETESSESEES